MLSVRLEYELYCAWSTQSLIHSWSRLAWLAVRHASNLWPKSGAVMDRARCQPARATRLGHHSLYQHGHVNAPYARSTCLTCPIPLITRLPRCSEFVLLITRAVASVPQPSIIDRAIRQDGKPAAFPSTAFLLSPIRRLFSGSCFLELGQAVHHFPKRVVRVLTKERVPVQSTAWIAEATASLCTGKCLMALAMEASTSVTVRVALFSRRF